MGSFLEALTVTICKNDRKQLQKPNHSAGRASYARDPMGQKLPPTNEGGCFCRRIVNIHLINRKTGAESATERHDNRYAGLDAHNQARKPVQ